MTNASQEQLGRAPDEVLEYGHAEPRRTRLLAQARAVVQERVDGTFEFLGMVLAMVGGGRQLGLSVGLALFAGGLGECLTRYDGQSGPGRMALGGLVLGLVVRLPVKRV